MSRAIALPDMRAFARRDPWEIEPNIRIQFVELFERKTDEAPGHPLPIDWERPIVARTRRNSDPRQRSTKHRRSPAKRTSGIDGQVVERQLRPSSSDDSRAT